MCEICNSELLEDINKKINWRPDRLLKWAGKRGLNIEIKQLEEHFDKHVGRSIPTKKEIDKTAPEKKKTDQKVIKQPARSSRSTVSHNRDKTSKAQSDKSPNHHPSDDQFLNEIISRVFQDLVEGNFELKLEHGFKAIEIKQKIADNTNVENLLLDLLNEIRSQELGEKSMEDQVPTKRKDLKS